VIPLLTDLRLGRYQDTLKHVMANAVIADPPYGEGTHKGQTKGSDGSDRRDVGEAYKHWTPEDVEEFCAFWVPRCDGWIGVMSCSDLSPVYRSTMRALGRYAFAPVPCVIKGMTVRQTGDGPSSWAVWLNLSRPRDKRFLGGWTRPGAYVVSRGPRPPSGRARIGGKPLELMRLIVGDYSLEGDLVVDPCAGHATTGVAALELGRRFVGSEVDSDAWLNGITDLSACRATGSTTPQREAHRG
jgi:site-specific DNA-methyltransferase (adenine-specific)